MRKYYSGCIVTVPDGRIGVVHRPTMRTCDADQYEIHIPDGDDCCKVEWFKEDELNRADSTDARLNELSALYSEWRPSYDHKCPICGTRMTFYSAPYPEPLEWHCEMCGFDCNEMHLPTWEDIEGHRYSLRETVDWWREVPRGLSKRRLAVLNKLLPHYEDEQAGGVR